MRTTQARFPVEESVTLAADRLVPFGARGRNWMSTLRLSSLGRMISANCTCRDSLLEFARSHRKLLASARDLGASRWHDYCSRHDDVKPAIRTELPLYCPCEVKLGNVRRKRGFCFKLTAQDRLGPTFGFLFQSK